MLSDDFKVRRGWLNHNSLNLKIGNILNVAYIEIVAVLWNINYQFQYQFLVTQSL